MKIYVGYILDDYVYTVFVGLKEKEIQKKLNEHPTKKSKWIEEYEIKNDYEVIELNCD